MPTGRPWKPKHKKVSPLKGAIRSEYVLDVRHLPANAATLRDEFAKTAERALLPLFNDTTLGNGWDDYDDFAETCYAVADAMMRARDKSR